MLYLTPISWRNLTSNDLLYHSPLVEYFKTNSIKLFQRNFNPPQKFSIGGEDYYIQLPITFTPYAAAEPCSARCWFCSENLRFDSHKGANSLKQINNYHFFLSKALDNLLKVPLGLSLSGLEFSDNLEWALNTIDCLLDWQKKGGVWTEKAMYSNLAGFTDPTSRKLLLNKLKILKLNRLEVSRHHYNEAINNKVMRFRENEKIQNNLDFLNALTVVANEINTRLVCILQKNAINNISEIYSYLEWSHKNKIKHVIFRELSDISDNRYNINNTFKNIQLKKISIERIIDGILKYSEKDIWKLLHIETGYYYWNAVFETPWGKIVFERSDYSFMKHAHESETLHKLIFHPNGNLCSDWTPDINILLEHNND